MSEGTRVVTETYTVQKRTVMCDQCGIEHVSKLAAEDVFAFMPTHDGWVRAALTYNYKDEERGVGKGDCQVLDFCSRACLLSFNRWDEVRLA